jgi:hypothetical protein
LKARPRQRDRAANSATETPSKTRRDFCLRRTDRQTPSRARVREGGSTEWRCRQHPSRGCSFAGRQPQPSANVNHEYTRMNTNVGKEMWLWLPDICAYRESFGHRLQEKPPRRTNQRTLQRSHEQTRMRLPRVRRKPLGFFC